MTKLRIVVERNVPFLEVLDSVADVVRLPYGEITADTVRDADALVVRTRNRCDASLLADSHVKFIATATIGTDHIDLPWCAALGIEALNAPGCNAPAVAQYVFSSLMRVINRPISSYTIGIVGVGHVGSIVERWARGLGMRVMLCDPPRQRAEGGDGWSSLDEIAAGADIITFHTPLTRSGVDATYHIADENFFNSLRRAPIIINSARGPIVDNDVWVEALEAGQCGAAIVDCWENEPQIDRRLLSLATIATPHIAGYSLEGKQRASQMALDALCRHFGLPALHIAGAVPPPPARSITAATALKGYNPLDDTAALKADPAAFESLRNNYRLRPELPEAVEG
mgnify:CR=1 FL=1